MRKGSKKSDIEIFALGNCRDGVGNQLNDAQCLVDENVTKNPNVNNINNKTTKRKVSI